MKSIKESFNSTQDIVDYLNGETRVDENLKDIFNVVKLKFKKAWEYLKGIVVKVGSYILPTDEEGHILPVISPLTAGQAYKDGMINTSNTLVVMDKEGQKITGCRTKPDDAKKLYGSGNSISYWLKALKECEDLRDENQINESEHESREKFLENFHECETVEDMINEVKMQNEDPEARYNVIVDDEMLKKRIEMALKNKKLARLLIWGAPGIGKTAILMNVLDSMKETFPDYKLIVKTLSNETPDNFTLPKYTEVVDDEDFEQLAKDLKKKPNYIAQLMRKVGMTKATDVPKTWLPVYKPTGDPELDAYLDKQTGNGLLFIDELSRATPQVLNVVLPLVNEGNFNGYKLGSGWTIVSASNRAEDEMSGQSEIGNALANRFAQVYYEPTVKTWRKWADKQNFISPLLLQWLSMPESENMSGGKFFYMDPNEDMDGAGVTKLMCTPRSWTNAMRELAGYSHTGTLEGFTIFDIPTSILKTTLNEYIPASAIDAFVAFLEVISKIGNFDAAVRDIWKNDGKTFKIDKKNLNKITLPIAQLLCTAHADKLPTKEEFESLANWLVSTSSDQLASYVLDVFKTVFLGTLPDDDNIRNGVFIIQRRIAKAGSDKSSLNIYNDLYAPFLKKWKIKDIYDIPDYSTGLVIISKKFQAAFKGAVVDGVEALG